MHTLTCKLPHALSAKLDALALAERRPKSAILREALEARLAMVGKNKPETAFDLVGHLSGSIEGTEGITDLATNPEHLRGLGL